jgi:hypothetical protein
VNSTFFATIAADGTRWPLTLLAKGKTVVVMHNWVITIRVISCGSTMMWSSKCVMRHGRSKLRVLSEEP